MMRMWIIFVPLLIGCGSSLSIPSKEESSMKIAETKPLIDFIDASVAVHTDLLPKGYDIISRTKISAVNMLLQRLTDGSKNDLRVDFLQTRPLWREEKSLLGIRYMNHIDVDTGTMTIDLKKFMFANPVENIVNAAIEIEGIGSIRVSGSYTGIAASTGPIVNFYLSDQIPWEVSVADSDYILLRPIPKTVLLKTKITIMFLGWNIPYYREIPLSSTDLVKPVLIPSALRSEIVFPVPAAQFGRQLLSYVHRSLVFTKTSISAKQNMFEYRGNIDFTNKE